MTNSTATAFREKLERFELNRRQKIASFRTEVDKRLELARKKKIDPHFKQVNLERGWLMPFLIAADWESWKRWEHWLCVWSAGGLVEQPIPRIVFSENKAVRDHITRSLDLIPNQGRESWMGWSSWTNISYFFGWILYGLGSPAQKELPPEPTAGASMRLFQYFDMNALIAYPYDYFGDLMAESGMGRSAGFFPTPHCLSHMMALMQFRREGQADEMHISDQRRETVQDPACGTGRMLLEASNYSYHLFGQEILHPVYLSCLVNMALYAPWGYMPLKTWDYSPTVLSSEEHHKSWRMSQEMWALLKEYDQSIDKSAEDRLTEQLADVDDETSFFTYAETLAAQAERAETEQQWRYEPITKKDAGILQGNLW